MAVTAATTVSDWLMTGPPWWLVIGTGAIVGAGLAFLRWVVLR